MTMMLRMHEKEQVEPGRASVTKPRITVGGKHMLRHDAIDRVRMAGAGVILLGGATFAVVRIVHNVGWSTQLAVMAAFALVLGFMSVLIEPLNQEVNEERAGSSGRMSDAAQVPAPEVNEGGPLLVTLSHRDAGEMTVIGNLVRQGAHPPASHIQRGIETVAKMAATASTVDDDMLRDELLAHAEELSQLLGRLADTHVPELPAEVQGQVAHGFSSAAGFIRQAVPVKTPERVVRP
jgi:hypothetical protein